MNNPPDFSSQIGSWLRSSLKLAESVSEEVTSELQALYDYWRLPSSRLAFVGILNRGKSTLINRLLERDELLPTGILPTTATLTSIIKGSTESMEVTFADGNRETRSLEKSSWDDLLATNQQGESQEVSATVQVKISNPWLEKIDVELIDTPPVGNIDKQSAVLLSKWLDQCDGVVLVLSAYSILSMTERTFLTEEIMGRNISRILVVVSNLDTLSQEEGLTVFNVVCEKVRQISPEIAVLPLHSLNVDTTEEIALEEVRTKIEEILVRENRRAWRSQRVAEQIISYIEQTIKISNTNIEAISMSANERENAIQQLQQDLKPSNLQWNEIKLELEQNRLKHNQELRQSLNKEKSELLKFFQVEIKQHEDLKCWWEEKFLVDWRRHLLPLEEKLNHLVWKNLTSDSQWLQEKVEEIFDIPLKKRGIDLLEQIEIRQELDRQSQLADVNKSLLRWQMFSGDLLTNISGLFAGPLLSFGAKEGAAIAITVWGAALAIPMVIFGIATGQVIKILANQRLQKSIEEQQELLEKELEDIFEIAFEQCYSEISDNLRLVYDELIDYIRQVQSKWYEEKVSIFEVNDQEADETHWQKIIADASSLQKEISQTVKGIN